MKKLIAIGLLLLGLNVSVQAQGDYQFFSTNITTTSSATNFNLTTNRWLVQAITVTDASGGNAITAQFRDNNIAAWTNYFAGYTSVLSYATSIVSSFTSTTGIIVTNTNSGITTVYVPKAAGLSNLPVIAQVTAPSSGTASTPVNLVTLRGLTVTVNSNAIVTLLYRPWQ